MVCSYLDPQPLAQVLFGSPEIKERKCQIFIIIVSYPLVTLAHQICSAAGQWHQGLPEERVLTAEACGRRDKPYARRYVTLFPNYVTSGSQPSQASGSLSIKWLQ